MNYRCLKGLVYPQVSEVENWPIEDGATGDGDTKKDKKYRDFFATSGCTLPSHIPTKAKK